MAKLYEGRREYSITFCASVSGSNNEILWTKVNFKLPPNVSSPNFQEIHNSFQALDTNEYKKVLDAIGLSQYQTSTTDGVTDTRYVDLVAVSTEIYFIENI